MGLAGFSHPRLQHALYGNQSRDQWLSAYGRCFGALELACTRLPYFDRATARRLAAKVPPNQRLLPATPPEITQVGGDPRQAVMDWHAAVEPILRSPNCGPVHVAWPGPHTPSRLAQLEQLLDLLWARLPWNARVAVEFQHRSWFRAQAMRLLEEQAAGLVWSTAAGLLPHRVTADFLYVRLTGTPWHGDEAADLAQALAARSHDKRPVHVISSRYHEPYGLAVLQRFAQHAGRELDLDRARHPASHATNLAAPQVTLDGYIGAVA